MKRSAILTFSLLALAAMTAQAQAGVGPGIVTITYSLFHPHWIASNQLAVWIEDAKDTNGAFVKTDFATDFMARSGKATSSGHKVAQNGSKRQAWRAFLMPQSMP